MQKAYLHTHLARMGPPAHELQGSLESEPLAKGHQIVITGSDISNLFSGAG